LTQKFQIINASAGSGKTFSLAKNVIIQILTSDEDSYKRILALTFTNNSANDMKKRILTELRQISIDPNKSLVFQSSNLIQHLSLNTAKRKAKRVLNKILHNFSFFQISTIDKFNHRLIRSFSSDLTLSYDFDLVIERDEFTDQLIEKFFNDLKKESFLLDLIINYSNNKHNKNKSWDITYDIKKLLDIIWDENNYKYVSNKKLDEESIKYIHKTLQETLIKISKKLKVIALKIENKISSIDQSSFSYNALPNLLKEIQLADINNIKTDQVFKRLKKRTLIKKTKINSDLNQLISELKPLINDIISLIHNYKTYYNLKHNLPLNYLIHNVVNFSRNFQSENNILLISDFNSLITENIADQSAPFIYEKIGTKYSNYYIDEFQDTSELQWRNMIPLTSHALLNEELNDEGGNLFLVGDPKQSIYRWRGAKPETFISLDTENPFYIKPKSSKLGVNYRSYSNIVDFNNKFFKNNLELLNIESIDSIYDSLNQNFLKEKKGGYLSFTFIKSFDKDYQVKTSEEVLKRIKQKQKQGFKLSDIAILCRSNKECNLASEFLMDNNIQVNSEELLALSSCKEVNFIIDIIKLLINANDSEAKKNIVKFVSIKLNKKDKYDFIKNYLNVSASKIFTEILNIDYNRAFNLDLYLACEYIISSSSFLNQSRMQTHFLLDEIYNFCYNKNPYSQSFIDYWQIKKDKLKVNLIEDTNAVKVLTIHKSKGLEFPVVILPFFDFKLNKLDKNIWVNFNDSKINGNFLVDFNESLNYLSEDASLMIRSYENNMILDNINVMYVSLSRSILETHIICKHVDSSHQLTSGMLLRSYINKISSKEKSFYQIGKSKFISLSSSNFKRQRIIDPGNDKNYNSLNNYYKSDKKLSTNFGNIFHNLMSEIEYKHQKDYVISEYFSRGIISNDDKQIIKNLVDQIISHKNLKKFFSKKNTIYNEREIFIPPERVIIPDKICVTSEKELSILDYKTGQKKNDHENQIKNYADVLKKANFRVKEAFLVYIHNKIDVIKIY
tara:strand:+ start:182 stop:3226 length:3045 start_codon:yes stop_codon:yes gene_type:complete